jgi:hypothetical protein
MTAKKNKTAPAMAPRIVIAFIISCGVVFSDLNLVPEIYDLKAKGLAKNLVIVAQKLNLSFNF